MKKIATIFKCDPDNMSRVLDEQHPDCGWVFDGDGAATRKYDGTCCMYDGEKWYKRREVKKGKDAPCDFMEADHDVVTGKRVGWVPIGDGPDDKYHREAIENGPGNFEIGTYELIGPKVQGNPEKCIHHVMLSHKRAQVFDGKFAPPRDIDGLREWLKDKDIEGLVFHHKDGRMAKIKKRDFGLARRPSPLTERNHK